MKFTRLFTQGVSDPYSLIHFRQPEGIGDGFDIPLEHPDGWSREAVETLADEAATCALPTGLNPVEENTVPSWLWRQARAKAVGGKETTVCAIFDRVAGAATYFCWKKAIFSEESQAKIFYDEARYLLATRIIGIEPQKLGVLGLKWAYGIEVPAEAKAPTKEHVLDITNAAIDTVVSGKRDRETQSAWQKLIQTRTKASSLVLRFVDTEAQWETPASIIDGARLNLLALRHIDGSLNIEALRQATRILVLLLDMQDEAIPDTFSIGFANLAPLLMALALPYDGEAARATAAAISAITSAEAYATSAELARQCGMSSAFVTSRDASLRALRNHRRAAYGEHNDYEKMPVTPAPLSLASCPDLALTAAARNAWDAALTLAQSYGLRHTQMTGFFVSNALALSMDSETEGLAPMPALTLVEREAATHRTVHPSVLEGLTRLDYDQRKTQSIAKHITGSATLRKAPAINHESLRARGFTEEALENLEEYLPQAKQLRYACTPWVVGVAFCNQALKVTEQQINDVRFDLLRHLGFSKAEIAEANAWCYGHDRIDGAAALMPKHKAVFATAQSLPDEARIRMAAAVQGFVSGEPI